MTNQTEFETDLITRDDLISFGFSSDPMIDLDAIAARANRDQLSINQAAWLAYQKAQAASQDICARPASLDYRDREHDQPLGYRIDWAPKAPDHEDRYMRARHAFDRLMSQPRVDGGELSSQGLAANAEELPIGAMILSQSAYMPDIFGGSPVQGEIITRLSTSDHAGIARLKEAHIDPDRQYRRITFSRNKELVAALRAALPSYDISFIEHELSADYTGLINTRIAMCEDGSISLSGVYRTHEIEQCLFGELAALAKEHTAQVNPAIRSGFAWIEADHPRAVQFQVALDLLRELRHNALAHQHEVMARVSGCIYRGSVDRRRSGVTRENGGSSPIIRHFREFEAE